MKRVVGIEGFEPPTPWSQTKRSTKLSHIPKSSLRRTSYWNAFTTDLTRRRSSYVRGVGNIHITTALGFEPNVNNAGLLFNLNCRQNLRPLTVAPLVTLRGIEPRFRG